MAACDTVAALHTVTMHGKDLILVKRFHADCMAGCGRASCGMLWQNSKPCTSKSGDANNIIIQWWWLLQAALSNSSVSKTAAPSGLDVAADSSQEESAHKPPTVADPGITA